MGTCHQACIRHLMAIQLLLPRSGLRRSMILCGDVLLCALLGAELPDHIEILEVHCFFC